MKTRHLRRVRLGAMTAGLLLTAAALPSPVQAQAPAAKPNILFIMADDIGWMQMLFGLTTAFLFKMIQQVWPLGTQIHGRRD